MKTTMKRTNVGGFPSKFMAEGQPYYLNNVTPKERTTLTVSVGPRQGVVIAVRLLWASLRAACRRAPVAFYIEHDEAIDTYRGPRGPIEPGDSWRNGPVFPFWPWKRRGT